MLISVVVALAVLTGASCEVTTNDESVEYLFSYGYIDKDSSTLRDENVLRNGIISFQKYFNLKPTGHMDNETKALMTAGRCGEPDINPKPDTANFADIAANYGNKFRVSTLRYLIKPMTPRSRELVREAFKFWQRETQFSFVQVSRIADADIVIDFVNPTHLRDYYTNGRYYTVPCSPLGPHALAHGSFPQTGQLSVIHVNLRSNWQIEDLWRVMVHELGHVLGLPHVNDRDSIMFPMSLRKPRMQHLSSIDRRFILRKYPEWGKPRNISQYRRWNTAMIGADFCVKATAMINGELFMFCDYILRTTKNPAEIDVRERFAVESGMENPIDEPVTGAITYDDRIALITKSKFIIYDLDLRFVEIQSFADETVDTPVIPMSNYLVHDGQSKKYVYKYDPYKQRGARVVGSAELESQMADIVSMSDVEFDESYTFKSSASATIIVSSIMISVLASIALQA